MQVLYEYTNKKNYSLIISETFVQTSEQTSCGVKPSMNVKMAFFDHFTIGYILALSKPVTNLSSLIEAT